MIDWILAPISIIGAILNAKQIKWGFILWIFANSGWVIFSFTAGIYGQVPLWIIYNVIAIWGFIKWHRQEKMHPKYKSEVFEDYKDIVPKLID